MNRKQTKERQNNNKENDRNKRVNAQRLKRVQEFTTICKTYTKKLTNIKKFNSLRNVNKKSHKEIQKQYKTTSKRCKRTTKL